ncbi:MAD-domain-containing protein [Amylocystis lapponica]|nr:MAD-domain-containing protein [Amylocystis lapponica]
MERDKFSTPLNHSSRFVRSSASKRDSFAAELERDPQLSTAKRQQRSQVFTSNLAHASLERQVLAAQTAKVELESKLREKEGVIERLQNDRRWLDEREKAEREEKERERAEHMEEKRKSDSELRALRSALSALREQHADLEDEHASLSRSTSQAVASSKAHISTLVHQVSGLEQELIEYKRIAEERSQAFDDLQAQFDDLNAAQVSLVQRESEEESWVVVREELHRQAEYMRTVEATNAKMASELNVLRERHTSMEVLKEQKRDLERKVQGVEDLREEVVRLEAELEAARRERETWATESVQSSTPSKTPVSVTQNLSNLRLAHARLLEENGSNLALLRRREVEVADADRRETEARAAIEKLQDEVRALKIRVGRSEHAVGLAEREVNFLRAMVASFTAEETSHGEIHVEEVTTQQVQQLEALVADYRSTMRKLEEEIEGLGGDPMALDGGRARKQLRADLEQEKAAKLEAERALQEAESATEKHLEQIEELEQTLFELRGEIGTGRHLPPGVRVLSLKDNPAQQWFDLSRSSMDRLKGENEALMKRIKELEKSGATAGSRDSEGLVPRASWEVLEQENKELQQLVKAKDRRLLRLQEVFAAKSTEFRETVGTILGYKLAFYPNGQVRVTSVYDLTAQFVFRPTDTPGEGSRMTLTHADHNGTQDLPQMMEYWVEREQCIPGFMASVTLECYEKSKNQQQ